MALTTMYPAKPNSPQTTLTADITAAATSMTVADASVLPSAPNLCTIGEDENAEVVLYNAISGNVVSGLIRGQSGTVASVWEAGTVIARDFTSYDHDTFASNISDLGTQIANLFKATETSDANNAPFGVSSINYTGDNAPFSDAYATIITISNSTGAWKQQIAVPWYGEYRIAFRARNQNGTWGSWKSVILS